MGALISKSPLEKQLTLYYNPDWIEHFTVKDYKKFGMKTSLLRLAKGFGELATIRGTTNYHLSPFEQKALAGVITHGIPNTLWRIKCSFLYVFPPFALAYVVYDQVEKEHDRLQRKQPGQFDHET